MPTKLIEVALPLDVINREAAREKSIRQGHPSTVHLWWARRPLAACRAVLFAQLVDDPSAHPDQFPTEAEQERERRRLFDIIERLVPWEATNNEKILEEARAEIRRCYPDGPPPIVDPFCGGGSIPLEAQRLGLEAHASDLNPVAVVITKALIELPPKFADRPPVRPDSGTTFQGTQSWQRAQGLAEDVRFYGHWLRDEAQRRIGHLYPNVTLPDGQQASVIAWLWARTVTCPNPACRSTMPLVRSFWLGKKKGKDAWVHPIPDRATKRVRFEIRNGNPGPSLAGTVGRTGATCIVCGSSVRLEYIRQQGRSQGIGTQLIAIVAEGVRQRIYLSPTPEHEQAAVVSRPDNVPDTELPVAALGFRVQAYGMTHHSDLFTHRQLQALCTLSDIVAETRQLISVHSNSDGSYADAVTTYLALIIDRIAMSGSNLVRWNPVGEKAQHMFGRQTVSMLWDFAEPNVFGTATGSLSAATEMTAQGIPMIAERRGIAVQADARLFSDSDAVVSTDPPYYDNVGYADLSDFFYIWLRRTLRTVYPEMLSTVLTPKSAELVADPGRFDGVRVDAERHFEEGFQNVFQRIAERLASDVPITVFYAFKQSEADDDDDNAPSAVASTGWEKMLEGLVGSGLMISGTWPMRTEMGSRLRGQASNALASSIVLVCRPRSAVAGITDRRGFIQELKGRLGHALHDLRSGGIAPVDLAQAAIGPGMAVFSSYARVIEPNGDRMRVRTALALINQVLDEVSAEQEGEFDEETRWAITWYAEHGMGDGPFGRADDLSRAKNVSVDGLVRAGIVKSGGGNVRLLDRDELDPNWDPTKDSRLTVWEVTQHLIRRLMNENVASAAELLAKVGGLGDAARDLAYRLFLIAESKKWSKEAAPYNALAASWLDISRLAAFEPDRQGTLFSRS
jgi:putative DNA methylase